MAGITRKDVEILVHTTAPSRGQDDARYRRMAVAYLHFRRATHQRIKLEKELLNKATGKLDKEAGSQLQEELRQATQESSTSYHPNDSSDEEDAYEYLEEHWLTPSQEQLHSPSLSFRSAADNADSPVFHARVTQHDNLPELYQSQGYEVADSWVAPPSEIPDSQPEVKNTMTVFSSPTRMLELYLQNQESQATESTPDKSPGQTDKTSSLELPLGLKGAMSSSPDHGLTPSSPSPVQGPGRRSERILQSQSPNPPSTQDPALNLKRKWVSSSSEEPHPSSAPPKPVVPTVQDQMSSQPLLPRLEKRPRLEAPPSRALSSSQPTRSSNRPATTPNVSSQSPGFWSDQLEIRPKPPATSTAELKGEMLITSHLDQVARRMPSRLYSPVSQKRELREMERGYWLFECKDWEEDLLQRCWNTLGRHIGRDLAGWGVWCIRNKDFKTIRVYCWGVVVRHIYLLLYMASENRIRKSGARWIGGDSETIIEM